MDYKRSKEKKKSEADKWERDWNKDKENFLEFFEEYLSKQCKKYPASFNIDDPDSDYRMVVEPVHIETGNPVKYSSVETKIYWYDVKTGEEVAEHYIPASKGAQMGPMSPTTGYRVQIALAGTAKMFAKYYKGLIK